MTTYRITVENKSNSPQDFFFFQKPAIYSGGAEVYTNSIGNRGLPKYKSGSINEVIFTLEQQYYAGAQIQLKPPHVGVAQIGELSQVPVDLAKIGSTMIKDGTNMIVTPDSFHLTPAVNTPGVEAGAFRIKTPSYDPYSTEYNIGLSCINGDGDIVLSNFITAEPEKNTDVQPKVVFYVSTGTYKAGTVVNFTTSSVNSAMCDATNGKLDFKVVYEADGTWTVS